MSDALSLLRTETQALRELLEQGGMQFEPLELETEAPPRVKVFWETLGWSDVMDRMFVKPTYEVARVRARKRLEDWLTNKMAKLTFDDLPERFRVVEDDGQGVGFTIVDETRGKDEPPLLFVSADHSKISRVRGSYLKLVVEALIDQAMKHQWCLLWLTLEPRSALEGKSPLPTLYPNLALMAPGLVGHKRDGRSHDEIFFASKAALFDWFESDAMRGISWLDLGPLPNQVPAPRPLEELLELLEARRDLPAKDVLARGRLYGSRVVVGGDPQGHSCWAWSEGDNDWLAAKLQDMPLHRIWPRRPGNGGAGIYSVPGKRPDDASFGRILSELRWLGQQAGPPPSPRVIPPDLPDRVGQTLEALGNTWCAPELPTLAESESRIQRFLETHREQCAPSTWLGAANDIEEARRCLPTRARVLADTPHLSEWRLVVTDEDGNSDDPPTICAKAFPYLWCNAPRVTFSLKWLAYDAFLNGSTRVRLRGANHGKIGDWFPHAPLRLSGPATTLWEIAENCFFTGGSLLFPSVRAYGDFLRYRMTHPNQADAMPLTVLVPPDGLSKVEAAVTGRGSRRKLHDLFERSLTRGFSVFSNDPFEVCAFGHLDLIPVWLTHRRHSKHSVMASCESGHEATVRAFFTELGRG